MRCSVTFRARRSPASLVCPLLRAENDRTSSPAASRSSSLRWATATRSASWSKSSAVLNSPLSSAGLCLSELTPLHRVRPGGETRGAACAPEGQQPAVKDAGLLHRGVLQRRAAQVDEERDRRPRDDRERDRTTVVKPERPRPRPKKERKAKAPRTAETMPACNYLGRARPAPRNRATRPPPSPPPRRGQTQANPLAPGRRECPRISISRCSS